MNPFNPACPKIKRGAGILAQEIVSTLEHPDVAATATRLHLYPSIYNTPQFSNYNLFQFQLTSPQALYGYSSASGTYTLTFTNLDTLFTTTTGAIAWNANAATIQNEIDLISELAGLVFVKQAVAGSIVAATSFYIYIYSDEVWSLNCDASATSFSYTISPDPTVYTAAFTSVITNLSRVSQPVIPGPMLIDQPLTRGLDQYPSYPGKPFPQEVALVLSGEVETEFFSNSILHNQGDNTTTYTAYGVSPYNKFVDFCTQLPEYFILNCQSGWTSADGTVSIPSQNNGKFLLRRQDGVIYNKEESRLGATTTPLVQLSDRDVAFCASWVPIFDITNKVYVTPDVSWHFSFRPVFANYTSSSNFAVSSFCWNLFCVDYYDTTDPTDANKGDVIYFCPLNAFYRGALVDAFPVGEVEDSRDGISGLLTDTIEFPLYNETFNYYSTRGIQAGQFNPYKANQFAACQFIFNTLLDTSTLSQPGRPNVAPVNPYTNPEIGDIHLHTVDANGDDIIVVQAPITITPVYL